MARQLTEAGEEIAFLGLIDTSASYDTHQVAPGQSVDTMDAAYLADRMPAALAAQARQLPLDAMLALCQEAGMFPAAVDVPTLRRHLAVRAGISRALGAYRPAPMALDVTLFNAADEQRTDPSLGWKALLGDRVRVIAAQGSHHSMMDEPAVAGLAQLLTAALSASAART